MVANTLNLTPAEERLVLENSLERVLNNAIWIGTKAKSSKNALIAERGNILCDDCEALKSIATRLWDSVRNEIHAKRGEL